MASGAFASAVVRQGCGQLILEIDIGQRLPVVITDGEAGGR
jgi:hypothetical protein